MKHNTLLYRLILAVAVFFLPTAAFPPAAWAQNSWCSTSSLTWTHGDTAPKTFTISSRDSAAYVLNASACSHFLAQSVAGSYSVSVTPFGANNSQSDIVQYLSVIIDDYGTPVTETVTLRHLAAPAPPEPDPWAAASADLPDTLSWIQRTTVTAADGSSSYRDVSFFDGMGYAEQEVLVGASPGGTKSIYTPIVYDKMRRDDAQTYLPYAYTTPGGVHDGYALSHQASFYTADPYQDARPYAEKAYESSPVGRPVSFQREGLAWSQNGGHKSSFSYRTNLTADAVPMYRVLPGTGKASCEGTWPAGTLLCSQTTDEEGAVSRTFTDAFGKTVLTESETGNTLPGGGAEKARTLYVYDLRDSLALVVQPEGMKALAALPATPLSSRDLSLTPGSSADNGGITDKFCFVWTYDGRGNVLSEHTPGGGTVRYAYDARNRLVLRADGRMSPTGTPSTRRMVLTLHDQFDRIVEERYVYSPGTSFETLQTFLRDKVSHTMSPSYITGYLPTLQVLRSAEYFPFSSFSYPSSGDGAFTPDAGIAVDADVEKDKVRGFLKSETVHPAPNPDGTVSADAPSVTRYYHYDSKGRVIQVKECWSDGRVRRVTTKHSFTGDVLATKETVITPPPGGTGTAQESSLVTVYTRDARGRVLSYSRVLDGTDILATVHYAYDDLGKLAGKTVGNSSDPVLKTDIDYDLHGWTTGIDVAVTDGIGSGMDTVFRERLYYADAKKDVQASRFDGNIAETAFSHRVVPALGGTPYLQTNTWSYDYDGLKRLKNASHYPGAQLTASLTDTERGFGYDLNGNIEALKRYGATGIENDLTFTHTGNRMTALVDANATGNEAGTKAFTYDVNGNMTSDGRKGLDLSWNVLNLVDSAAMHGSSLKYAWLSDGTKVAARADDGSGSGVQKRYLGSFVYTSNTGISMDAPTEIESLAWDEGRIFFDSSMAVAVDDPALERGGAGVKQKSVLKPRGNREAVDTIGVADSLAWITYYRDCWFAGDHLGNVRSVIDITPGLIVPEILEQSDYLPYGTRIQNPSLVSMSDNRWRYAAKEEQRYGALDLSLLDFGARMYDPFIVQWIKMDPLADQNYPISPYDYCAKNPIFFYDPTGKIWEDANGKKITDHSNIKVYIFYDPSAFQKQSKQMYKDAVEVYGEGSVAMSKVTTEKEFAQDWKDMASDDIREVNLNYHGGHQTINLDYNKQQYLSSTINGRTPIGFSATRISDLPTPLGNIQNAQLNINSCRSNNVSAVKDGGPTVARSFLDNTSFHSVRTTDKGVSYWYWFSPNRPHPQDDSAWQYLNRKIPTHFPGKGLPPK